MNGMEWNDDVKVIYYNPKDSSIGTLKMKAENGGCQSEIITSPEYRS
jgi:hypothetical protein